MKKKILLISVILGIMFFTTPVMAASKDTKKVNTNYQFKLVCGYHNGSDELTWGSQEFISDFKSKNGDESNNSRACGETTATKKYPIGNPKANNLPYNSTITFDNCTGSTGKQTARVGQSCSQEGKVKTCVVKWTGYCYKTEEALNKAIENNKKFTLTKKKIKVGQTTKVKKANACTTFKVEDENILSYDENTKKFEALASGETYISCYDNEKNYLSRQKVTVTAPANYRYVNQPTSFYETLDLNDEISTLRTCRKVNFLNERSNGYCKVQNGNNVGYVECMHLSTAKPQECK